jgi:hypothetical protein
MLHMTIQKVVRKYALDEEPSDRVAWRHVAPAERLAALESIRSEFHRWRYGAEPRLQRVARVTRSA